MHTARMERWTRVRTDEEYEAYAHMRNAMYPCQPTDGPAMRNAEAHAPPSAELERYLLLRRGEVAGAGIVMQAYFFDAPGLYVADALVPPDRTDVFADIHERVTARAVQMGAQRIRTMVSSLADGCCAGLRKRGFVEGERFPVTCLEVDAFAFDAFPEAAPAGIEIVPLTSYIERHREEWLPKIWRFDMELSRDMPLQEEWSEIPFDTYRGHFFDVPSFEPALHFVALSEGELVGITMLNLIPSDPRMLETGLTGVRRDHRRRGLATVLKARAIREARRRGFQRIVTENESTNPMLALNERMGFRRAYDEIVLTRPATSVNSQTCN